MESNPFIGGPLELVKHGITHLRGGNDFDLRIAMISIDNAVEVTINTYLALNRRTLNIKRNDYKNAIQSFPILLDALQNYVPNKVSNVELDAIEQLHSLRNSLYHQGNGITVEKNIVDRYSILTKTLISRLFDVNTESLFLDEDEFFKLFGEYLSNWSELETNSKKYSHQVEVPIKHYKLSFRVRNLYEKDLMNVLDVENLKYMYDFRNKLVHGSIKPTINELRKEIDLIKKVNTKLKENLKNKEMQKEKPMS